MLGGITIYCPGCSDGSSKFAKVTVIAHPGKTVFIIIRGSNTEETDVEFDSG